MTKLIQLNACFIRWSERVEEYEVADGPLETWRARGCPVKKVTGPRVYVQRKVLFAEAQGVMFACPLCYKKNGNSLVGTHMVRVAFEGRGLPDHLGTHNMKEEPVRWAVTGDSLTNLTIRPSILLEGSGCQWHGYVTNGEAE